MNQPNELAKVKVKIEATMNWEPEKQEQYWWTALFCTVDYYRSGE